ncbi:MAG: LysR family transcriptional regulator [Clostridiales bacterium]|nr:LysR family transcriptional regulator [Clostridiales bacterium]
MDTKQLQTFITLSDTLNYQRAAERLQYAPSSLFRHIQLMEEELGTTLFYKNGRQLELTEDGKRLLPDAQRLLSGWQDFMGAAREGGEDRPIAVGGCEMNTSYSLHELLGRFAKRYPDAHYSMTTSPNAAVPELLRAGLIDFGFYYSTTQKRPQGLASIPLYRETLFPCTAPGHPLRGKKALHWADLAGLSVAHPHDNCCFITVYREAMRVHGVSCGKLTFLGSIALIAEHAEREKTLLLIPMHALPRFREDFGVAPLDMDEEPMRFWESVLCRGGGDLSPQARRLVRFAAEYASSELSDHPEAYEGPDSFEPYLAVI